MIGQLVDTLKGIRALTPRVVLLVAAGGVLFAGIWIGAVEAAAGAFLLAMGQAAATVSITLVLVLGAVARWQG